jgi:hypothetical protein
MYNPVKLPIWSHALEALKDGGHIEWGKTISFETLEDLIRDPRDSMKFIGAMINIRNHLKIEDGIFLSEKGTNGKGYRVLEREECCKYTMDDARRKIQQTLRNAIGLGALDRDGLPDAEVSKIDKAQMVCANIAARQLDVMNGQTEMNPEMDIKSMRQVAGV